MLDWLLETRTHGYVAVRDAPLASGDTDGVSGGRCVDFTITYEPRSLAVAPSGKLLAVGTKAGDVSVVRFDEAEDAKTPWNRLTLGDGSDEPRPSVRGLTFLDDSTLLIGRADGSFALQSLGLDKTETRKPRPASEEILARPSAELGSDGAYFNRLRDLVRVAHASAEWPPLALGLTESGHVWIVRRDSKPELRKNAFTGLSPGERVLQLCSVEVRGESRVVALTSARRVHVFSLTPTYEFSRDARWQLPDRGMDRQPRMIAVERTWLVVVTEGDRLGRFGLSDEEWTDVDFELETTDWSDAPGALMVSLDVPSGAAYVATVSDGVIVVPPREHVRRPQAHVPSVGGACLFVAVARPRGAAASSGYLAQAGQQHGLRLQSILEPVSVEGAIDVHKDGEGRLARAYTTYEVASSAPGAFAEHLELLDGATAANVRVFTRLLLRTAPEETARDWFKQLVFLLLRRAFQLDAPGLPAELAATIVRGIEAPTGSDANGWHALRRFAAFLRKWVVCGRTYAEKQRRLWALYRSNARREGQLLDALVYLRRLADELIDVHWRDAPQAPRDSTWCVAASSDGEFVLRSTNSGQLLACRGDGRALQWSHADDTLLAASGLQLRVDGRALEVARAADFHEQYQHLPYMRAVRVVQLPQDERYIVVFSVKGWRRVDLQTSSDKQPWQPHVIALTVSLAPADESLQLLGPPAMCPMRSEVYSLAAVTGAASDDSVRLIAGTSGAWWQDGDGQEGGDEREEVWRTAVRRSFVVLTVRHGALELTDELAQGQSDFEPPPQTRSALLGERSVPGSAEDACLSVVAHQETTGTWRVWAGFRSGLLAEYERPLDSPRWQRRGFQLHLGAEVRRLWLQHRDGAPYLWYGTASGVYGALEVPLALTPQDAPEPIHIVHGLERSGICGVLELTPPIGSRATRVGIVTCGGSIVVHEAPPQSGDAATTGGALRRIERVNLGTSLWDATTLELRHDGVRPDRRRVVAGAQDGSLVALEILEPWRESDSHSLGGGADTTGTQGTPSAGPGPEPKETSETDVGDGASSTVVSEDEAARSCVAPVRLNAQAKTLWDSLIKEGGELNPLLPALHDERTPWLRVLDVRSDCVARFSVHLRLDDLGKRAEPDEFVRELRSLMGDAFARGQSRLAVAKALWGEGARYANELASGAWGLTVEGWRPTEAVQAPVEATRKLKTYEAVLGTVEDFCNRWIHRDPTIESSVLMYSFKRVFDANDVLVLAWRRPSAEGLAVRRRLLYDVLDRRLTFSDRVVQIETLRVINDALLDAVERVAVLESEKGAPWCSLLALRPHDPERTGPEWNELRHFGFVDLMTMVGNVAVAHAGRMSLSDPLDTEITRFFARCLLLMPHCALNVGQTMSESLLLETRRRQRVDGLRRHFELARRVVEGKAADARALVAAKDMWDEARGRFEAYTSETILVFGDAEDPWEPLTRMAAAAAKAAERASSNRDEADASGHDVRASETDEAWWRAQPGRQFPPYTDEALVLDQMYVRHAATWLAELRRGPRGSREQIDAERWLRIVCDQQQLDRTSRYFRQSAAFLSELMGRRAKIIDLLDGGDDTSLDGARDVCADESRRLVSADLFEPQRTQYAGIIQRWRELIAEHSTRGVKLLRELGRIRRHVHHREADDLSNALLALTIATKPFVFTPELDERLVTRQLEELFPADSPGVVGRVVLAGLRHVRRTQRDSEFIAIVDGSAEDDESRETCTRAEWDAVLEKACRTCAVAPARAACGGGTPSFDLPGPKDVWEHCLEEWATGVQEHLDCRELRWCFDEAAGTTTRRTLRMWGEASFFETGDRWDLLVADEPDREKRKLAVSRLLVGLLELGSKFGKTSNTGGGLFMIRSWLGFFGADVGLRLVDLETSDPIDVDHADEEQILSAALALEVTWSPE